MPNLISLLIGWLLQHLVALGFLIFLGIAICAWQPWALTAGAPEDAERTIGSPALPEAAHPVETPAAPAPAESPVQAEVFRPLGQTDGAPEAASDHDQFVPLNAREDAPPQQAGSQIPSDPVDVNGLLGEARKAFWNGALERAEMLYLRYLALRPGDANSFGELGNLYQSMGRREDALDAYFEAGVRFRSMGDQEQLRQIVELLIETGDPRARQLAD